jgi:hypothetical protein
MLTTFSVCIGAALVDPRTGKESGEDNGGRMIKRSEEMQSRRRQSLPLGSHLSGEKGSHSPQRTRSANAAQVVPSFIRSAGIQDRMELPFERRLIGKNRLPEWDMEQMMISTAISSHHPVKEYEKESHADPDPDIRSQTRIYSLAAEQAILTSRTPLRLDGLACGSRICMGIISGGTERDYTEWTHVFSNRPELAGLRLTTMVSHETAGRLILRIAFPTLPLL